MCEKLGVTRAGYYKYLKKKGKKKKETKKEKELKEYTRIIYHDHHKNFGYRKIHGELPVSEKIVRRLMKELGLKSQARRKRAKSVNGNKVTSAGHIFQNL